MTVLRHALRRDIVTPAIQRTVLHKLVADGELDEALHILKTFKTLDLSI